MGRVTSWLLLAAGLAAVALASVSLPRLLQGDASVVRSTPNVVLAVRDLSRLETVAFHIERVIDVRDRQSALFGLIKTQDAVLFVAIGEVTAGVDLGELRDGDVTVDQGARSARVTLPPPKVHDAPGQPAQLGLLAHDRLPRAAPRGPRNARAAGSGAHAHARRDQRRHSRSGAVERGDDRRGARALARVHGRDHRLAPGCVALPA